MYGCGCVCMGVGGCVGGWVVVCCLFCVWVSGCECAC